MRNGDQSSSAWVTIGTANIDLTVQGLVIGALSIYSTEAEAFNDEESRLLSQLAGDLSFGISALRA